MANLYFPQLISGALAQFPIRKTRLARTIKNVLEDGSMILLADPTAAHVFWELSYVELSTTDIEALQSLFRECSGPYRSFTFIDPTDNMLNYSSDLQASVWQTSSLIQVTAGASDPKGGTGAFMVTNTAQANQEITQSLAVPGNYQYCFSLYALSSQTSELELLRRGSSTETRDLLTVGPGWQRLTSYGRLADPGTTLTVGISLAPGQQIAIYGTQLEPQLAPSRYKATPANGGVYANAHWAMDQLVLSADAPNLFSTLINIEAAVY